LIFHEYFLTPSGPTSLPQVIFLVTILRKTESRAITGRTARCRFKFRCVSSFTISRQWNVYVGYAKHGNLVVVSTRTHLPPKPTRNTLNRVKRSFKVTNFGITEKPTRNCILLYNNVGFRVRNFEGKVWAFPFSRTPPQSFGTPCPLKPCEYSHKDHTFKNYIHWRMIRLHYRRAWLCASIFIRFLWRSFESRMLWVKQLALKPSLTWNSYSRSF